MKWSRWSLWACAAALLSFTPALTGCGDDSGRETDSDGASGGSTTDPLATGTGGSTGATATTGASETGGGSTAGGSTGATSTTAGSQTSDAMTTAGNEPPQIDSDPETEIILEQEIESNFETGQVLIASSVTDEIRVYDAESLVFIKGFTHPLFSEIDSPSYQYGPQGMVFNERGNLVVAAYSSFVEFSDYGVEYATYPKFEAEATENLIIDCRGALFTTTATGGSDRLLRYTPNTYDFDLQLETPPGASQYTGITFDNKSRLYLASQGDNTIHVSQYDKEFDTYEWVQALPGANNGSGLEGLQFNANGELVAAQGEMIRYDVEGEQIVGTFSAPDVPFPVPVRVDNDGRIYTADYENGNGTLPADIIRYTPDGADFIKTNDPGLFGPFGLLVTGTVLAGDPGVLFTYQVVASDPDDDVLIYSLLVAPEGMEIDELSGLITWTVTSADIGSHDVTVQVEDEWGATDEQAFVIVISGA